MIAKGNRNRTLVKLEKKNEALIAALRDLMDYVEEFGQDSNGKLTRYAEKAMVKAKKVLS